MVSTSSGIARAWSSTMRPTTIATASLSRRALFPAAADAATHTTCGRCSIINFNSRSRSACWRATAAPPDLGARVAMFGHCKKSTSSPSASSMANVLGGSPGPQTAARTRTSTDASPTSAWSSRTSGRHGATATRRHSASPHSRLTCTRASRSMAMAASRVSALTRCCLMPRLIASRRSAFQASARGVDCSSRYAASASATISSTTRSGNAMRSLMSPSRCALSVAANSLPSKSHTGFSCRRFTPARGWNGSIASVPAGVGCVQTHALRRTTPRSHARTPGSAEISAAATCVKALSTCSAVSYPVSGPTYTEAASSGDMSGTALSSSPPR
mmetsp:Transcript_13690/g.58485  ORF Transcript_13690/g.58485 Transcript_13690/m.58485 type:complete len:330 (+) Transcript_13690:2411-3400(+)